MLSCFKTLLNKTYWDKIYSTFLYLVLQTPTDDSYLMVEKNKKEKKPYILFYKRCLKECHVVNFVTKIKPGKKKIYKSNTHVLLNDEVDFFLCSKWKITENAYNSQIFFKKKTVQVIVTFTNKTFINHEVERSYSGKLHTLCVTRRFDNQSWIY